MPYHSAPTATPTPTRATAPYDTDSTAVTGFSGIHLSVISSYVPPRVVATSARADFADSDDAAAAARALARDAGSRPAGARDRGPGGVLRMGHAPVTGSS